MAIADYKLRAFNASGTLQAEITDFIFLSYSKIVNDVGILTFRLNGQHQILATLSDKWQFEVWRRPVGQSWIREGVYLFRDEEWIGDTDGDFIDIVCYDIKHMLSWRIVNWSADTTDRTKFINKKAETVMKSLVDFNCTSNASTANGRKRAGTITGVTVQSDGANGNNINVYCHGQVLLDVLQKIAPIAGGDFDLVKTAAATYQFQWFTGQLGTDRTLTVKFAKNLGNMGQPRYKKIRSVEKTVAAVWGQGEGDQRDYTTQTGDNFSSANDIEVLVDARDVDPGDTSALADKGDEKLEEVQARSQFDFTVLQIPSTQYQTHYDLGDLVVVINPYTGSINDQKINYIGVSIDSQANEIIQVETITPP